MKNYIPVTFEGNLGHTGVTPKDIKSQMIHGGSDYEIPKNPDIAI
jgi:hypothetical protein